MEGAGSTHRAQAAGEHTVELKDNELKIKYITKDSQGNEVRYNVELLVGGKHLLKDLNDRINSRELSTDQAQQEARDRLANIAQDTDAIAKAVMQNAKTHPNEPKSFFGSLKEGGEGHKDVNIVRVGGKDVTKRDRKSALQRATWNILNASNLNGPAVKTGDLCLNLLRNPPGEGQPLEGTPCPVYGNRERVEPNQGGDRLNDLLDQDPQAEHPEIQDTEQARHVENAQPPQISSGERLLTALQEYYNNPEQGGANAPADKVSLTTSDKTTAENLISAAEQKNTPDVCKYAHELLNDEVGLNSLKEELNETDQAALQGLIEKYANQHREPKAGTIQRFFRGFLGRNKAKEAKLARKQVSPQVPESAQGPANTVSAVANGQLSPRPQAAQTPLPETPRSNGGTSPRRVHFADEPANGSPQEENMNQDAAATTIQSNTRGWITRLKNSRAATAATKMGKAFRRWRSSKASKKQEVEQQAQQENEAAINIQKVFRGYRARKAAEAVESQAPAEADFKSLFNSNLKAQLDFLNNLTSYNQGNQPAQPEEPLPIDNKDPFATQMNNHLQNGNLEELYTIAKKALAEVDNEKQNTLEKLNSELEDTEKNNLTEQLRTFKDNYDKQAQKDLLYNLKEKQKGTLQTIAPVGGRFTRNKNYLSAHKELPLATQMSHHLINAQGRGGTKEALKMAKEALKKPEQMEQLNSHLNEEEKNELEGILKELQTSNKYTPELESIPEDESEDLTPHAELPPPEEGPARDLSESKNTPRETGNMQTGKGHKRGRNAQDMRPENGVAGNTGMMTPRSTNQEHTPRLDTTSQQPPTSRGGTAKEEPLNPRSPTPAPLNSPRDPALPDTDRLSDKDRALLDSVNFTDDPILGESAEDITASTKRQQNQLMETLREYHKGTLELIPEVGGYFTKNPYKLPTDRKIPLAKRLDYAVQNGDFKTAKNIAKEALKKSDTLKALNDYLPAAEQKEIRAYLERLADNKVNWDSYNLPPAKEPLPRPEGSTKRVPSTPPAPEQLSDEGPGETEEADNDPQPDKATDAPQTSKTARGRFLGLPIGRERQISQAPAKEAYGGDDSLDDVSEGSPRIGRNQVKNALDATKPEPEDDNKSVASDDTSYGNDSFELDDDSFEQLLAPLTTDESSRSNSPRPKSKPGSPRSTPPLTERALEAHNNETESPYGSSSDGSTTTRSTGSGQDYESYFDNKSRSPDSLVKRPFTPGGERWNKNLGQGTAPSSPEASPRNTGRTPSARGQNQPATPRKEEYRGADYPPTPPEEIGTPPALNSLNSAAMSRGFRTRDSQATPRQGQSSDALLNPPQEIPLEASLSTEKAELLSKHQAVISEFEKVATDDDVIAIIQHQNGNWPKHVNRDFSIPSTDVNTQKNHLATPKAPPETELSGKTVHEAVNALKKDSLTFDQQEELAKMKAKANTYKTHTYNEQNSLKQQHNTLTKNRDAILTKGKKQVKTKNQAVLNNLKNKAPENTVLFANQTNNPQSEQIKKSLKNDAENYEKGLKTYNTGLNRQKELKEIQDFIDRCNGTTSTAPKTSSPTNPRELEAGATDINDLDKANLQMPLHTIPSTGPLNDTQVNLRHHQLLKAYYDLEDQRTKSGAKGKVNVTQVANIGIEKAKLTKARSDNSKKLDATNTTIQNLKSSIDRLQRQNKKLSPRDNAKLKRETQQLEGLESFKDHLTGMNEAINTELGALNSKRSPITKEQQEAFKATNTQIKNDIVNLRQQINGDASNEYKGPSTQRNEWTALGHLLEKVDLQTDCINRMPVAQPKKR